MSDAQDKLLDHDYDGIKELDNELPRWWVWLFIITVVWGLWYLLYYEVLNIGYSSSDQYAVEIDPDYLRASDASPKTFGIVPTYRSVWYDPIKDNKAKPKKSSGVAVIMSREKDTTIYVATAVADELAAGKAIFTSACFTCHGKLGEGGIGPNLTDDYWLHGAQFSDIVKTIKYGVPAKGMVAWRGDLRPEQIIQVASFITTLRGTNPPNQKAPQGDLVKP